MEPNPYEAIIEDEPQVPQPPDQNPYLEILEAQQQHQDRALRESFRNEAETTPATRTEAIQLADQYRMPVDLVERNLDVFRKRAKEDLPDYELLLERAPRLAEWLTQNRQAIAAARGDLTALVQLENNLTFGAAILRGVDNVQGLWGRAIEATGEALNVSALTAYGKQVAEYNEAQSAGLGRVTQLSDVRDLGSFLQWAKEGLGSQIPIMAPAIAGSIIGGAVLPGTISVLGVKATIGSLLGAFLPMEVFGVGETQATIKQLDPNAEVPLAAFLGGSAIGAFDTALPGRLGGSLVRTFGRETAEQIAKRVLLAPVKPKFLIRSTKGTVSAFATEGLTEALQEAIGNVAGALGTGTPVDWKQTWDEMVEAGAAGALVGAVSGGASVALTQHTLQARYAAAKQQETFFNALADGARGSELAKSLPQAFQDFLAHATKDGPVETIYAPVDTFVSYWQGQNVSPAAVAAELTGNVDALAEAEAAGVDLAIPTAAYAAKLAATEHHAFFAKELKLDPAGMNAREAAEVKAELERQAAAIQAATAEPAKAVETPIRQAIVSQLIADAQFQALAAEQGVDPTDAAQAYAVPVEAVFVSLGTRIGQDPVTLFQRYGLSVGPRGVRAGVEPAEGVEGGAPGERPAVSEPASGAPAPEAGVPVEPAAEGAMAAQADELEGRALGQPAMASLAIAPAGIVQGRLKVSTRVPTAVSAPLAEGILRTDLAALQGTKGLAAKLGQHFRHARQLTEAEARVDAPEAVVERLVQRMTENLLWLWETFPAHLRERAKLWYVGAHRIAQDLADEHELTDAQATAVLATLSPQQDWNQNVDLAERVMRLVRQLDRTDPVFSPDLIAYYVHTTRRGWAATERGIVRRAAHLKATDVREIQKGGATPAVFRRVAARLGRPAAALQRAYETGLEDAARYHRQRVKNLREMRRLFEGQTWSALPLEGKARLLRAIDETTATRAFHVVLPEGERGPLVRTAAGELGRSRWGNYDTIAAAISVIRDGSVENIHQQLGTQHKVRSFFNNISNPWDPDSVTIDTHAIGAARLEAMTSNSPEAIYAMNGPEDTRAGLFGASVIYSEPYFRAAEALGVLPREVQSVTWEAIRALFTQGQKYGSTPAKVRALWEAFRGGKLTSDGFRAALLTAAGGFRSPAWADTPPRVALDEGRLRAGDVQPLRPDISARRGGDRAGAEGSARRTADVTLGPAVRGILTYEQGAAEGPGLAGPSKAEQRRSAVRSRLGRFRPSGLSQPYARGSDRGAAQGRRVVAVHVPTLPFVESFAEIEYPTPTVVELAPTPENAAEFRAQLARSKAASPIGPQVYVYDAAEYEGMRLFVTPEGRGGFALKPDGDIVSVFSAGGGQVHALVALAVQQGGRKLDCFDTMLPRLYAINGFRVVRRDPWNDLYAPEGWDPKAFARYNNGRPDVVYMEFDETLLQSGEREFFQSAVAEVTEHEWATSRILTSVQLANLPKAPGRQWKATITNSKIGVNRDEFLFVGLEDLDNDTVYTKQEVLDYIRTNQLRVTWTTLGEGPGKAELDALASKLYDQAVEDMVRELEDKIDYYSATAEELREGVWFSRVDGALVSARTYDSEDAALYHAQLIAERTRNEDIREAAKAEVDYDDAVTEAREQLGEQAGLPEFEQYQLNEALADPGSYREVMLQAPQFGFTGWAALSSQENLLLRTKLMNVWEGLYLIKTVSAEKNLSEAETRALYHQRIDEWMANWRHHLEYEVRPNVAEGLRSALAIMEKLKAADDFTFRERAWVDGHSQYGTIENPIVRLRFNTRTLEDGRRVMFLEEVQPPQPHNFERMPPLLQKNWRELAFKWALHYATTNQLAAVAWTTGQMQADRYGLAKAVERISWQPIREYTNEHAGGGRLGVTFRLRLTQHGTAAPYRYAHVILNDDLVVQDVNDEAPDEWKGHRLDEIVGKDLAVRIRDQARGEASGDDLIVGGEGLRKLYDVDFVNVANKLPAVKKAGARVTQVPIVTQRAALPVPAGGGRARGAAAAEFHIETTAVPAIEITPEVGGLVRAGQTLFQGERGRIVFSGDRQVRVELLADRDLSTFLHETGHLYLEVLGDVVRDLAGLDPQSLSATQRMVVQDYQTILQHLGVQDRSQLGVAQHEEFARLFEAYLLEGKAPSVQLRSAFARFRTWLVQLYKAVANLRVVLSPEVREVFDRLLATDQAIQEAQEEAHLQPLFATAEAAGMTEAEFAVYRKTAAEAGEKARDALQARLLQEFTRERTKRWKARRQVLEVEVRATLEQQPIYRALLLLQRGELPGGAPAPVPMKLSRAAIVAKWGEARLKTLPKPWVYAVDGGLDPDAAAELWGFSSGDALLTELATADRLETAINKEVRTRMQAEFGDLRADGSLAELARRAVQENGQQAVLEAELRAIRRKADLVRPFVAQAKREVRAQARQARETAEAEATAARATARTARRDALANVRRVVPLELLRETADKQIAGMRLRDIKPHTFWAAATKAGQAALDAAIQDQYEEAAKQKQRQRLAVELYRAASRALEEGELIGRYARHFQDTATRARLGKAGDTYVEQIDAVLERFEFVPVSGRTLQRRQTLLAWLEERATEGLPTDGIDAETIEAARQVNYRSLTMMALRQVRDTLRQIDHLASLKNRLLKNKEARAYVKVRDGLVEQLEKSKRDDLPIEYRHADERKRTIKSFFAQHAKIARLARHLDGHVDNGPLWRALIRPLNEAQDAETERKRVEGVKLARIVQQHYPGRDLATWDQKRYIPEIQASLSKEARLAVALNWGNETSRQRLIEDPRRHWTEDQVRAILETLDRRDWQFVQGVWDYLETFWPEIAEKQKRVTGLAPEKVEALPVSTRFGTFRGGYYPLAYDPRMAARAGQVQQASEAKLSMQAAYVRTTTRRGHVETRLQHVERPVRLDLGVIFGHLDQVIHDLTHHEALIDVSRLLRDRKVSTALLEAAGDPVYQQFTSALTDIAVGYKPGQNMLDRAATFMKTGSQVAALGFNLWTAMQQPLGIFNGMARVGPVWVLRGLGRAFRDAAHLENTAAWIRERSPMMRNRASTATQDLNDLRKTLSRPGGWFDGMLRTVTRDRMTAQQITDTFLWHIGLAQRLADIPTWLGAYEKAMAEQGGDEELAARLADQAVLDSQGGGEMKDLAQIQRGGPVARLFLTFYSYGSTLYNATADAAGQVKWKNPLSVAHFLGDLTLLYVMPAFCTVLLSRMLGRTGDDDDEPTAFVKEFGTELLSTGLNTMVLVRELGGVARGGDYRGWSGPSGARAINQLYALVVQAKQGEFDRDLWKAFNSSAGIIFRYPAQQVQRTIDGFVALEEGRTQNPAALLVGPTQERR